MVMGKCRGVIPGVGSGSWADLSTGSKLQLLDWVYRTTANLEEEPNKREAEHWYLFYRTGELSRLMQERLRIGIKADRCSGLRSRATGQRKYWSPTLRMQILQEASYNSKMRTRA